MNLCLLIYCLIFDKLLFLKFVDLSLQLSDLSEIVCKSISSSSAYKTGLEKIKIMAVEITNNNFFGNVHSCFLFIQNGKKKTL